MTITYTRDATQHKVVITDFDPPLVIDMEPMHLGERKQQMKNLLQWKLNGKKGYPSIVTPKPKKS